MAQTFDQRVMNTTVIMHNMIFDICKNSSPDKGLAMSDQFYKQLKEIKDFNYEYIYRNKRLEPFCHYSELVLSELFQKLLGLFDGKYTWGALEKERRTSPKLIGSFGKWLSRYCSREIVPDGKLKDISLRCDNKKINQNLETLEIYAQAIIDFISGMTDRYAIELFNELLVYEYE